MKSKTVTDWKCEADKRFVRLVEDREGAKSGPNRQYAYSFLVTSASCYAQCCYLAREKDRSLQAACIVVSCSIENFYGDWRRVSPTPSGSVDPDYWRANEPWFDQVIRSLPWSCAVGDWEAARKIAEYPVNEAFPEAHKAKGETAWLRALICYLRNEPRANIEAYLTKAEGDKAKRPKLLVPVLRALMDKDEAAFRDTLLAYLAYYRKSEYKLVLDKVLALDGTTLYHLGQRLGFIVELPANVADHIIRF